MDKALILFLCLACVAGALARRAKFSGTRLFAELRGWQKLVGLIAVILAFLILLSPEFAALGLLGDASFFDLLVLALSAQLLGYVKWVWRGLFTIFMKGLGRIGIPSPGFRFLMAVSSVALAGAISTIQKFIHRIMS